MKSKKTGVYAMMKSKLGWMGLVSCLGVMFASAEAVDNRHQDGAERGVMRERAILPSWRGGEFAKWQANEDIRNCRVEGDSLKGEIVGRDSQLSVNVERPFAPKNNQFVVFRLRTNCTGYGSLFWQRQEDAAFSDCRQHDFALIGDNEWHDYRVRPGWIGESAMKRLRFDFPSGFAADSRFEIASFGVIAEGGELPVVDAATHRGVAFALQLPQGLHYCKLRWNSETMGNCEASFTSATDGREHEYWLDMTKTRVRSGSRRGKCGWQGKISNLTASRRFEQEPLTLKRLRFLNERPAIAADPVITSVDSAQAIPRAGRPFVLEAVVRNYGTQPVTGMKFAIAGLPAGVAVLNPELLAPPEALAGADGRDSIDNFGSAGQLASERVLRFRLGDLGVGRHRLALTMTADGIAPQTVRREIEVLPSLGLKAVDYPPEPKPIRTGRYEIGALLFPGWSRTGQGWHAVWSHEPQRKPLLGWYDESKPETIDWQIKHLVENGISFVSVDWYWHNGKQHLNHWMKAFAKAKYRKYLKWHLMWDNSYNSLEDQAEVTKFWCENYFGDEQYQKIDGKPVVAICGAAAFYNRMDGKGVALTQQIARQHGFKGVYFVAMRGMGADSEAPEFLASFAKYGFDLTTVYGFRGGIPGTTEGARKRRSFTWMADVSLDHWRAIRKNSTLPFWPSISTGYDDRPWRGDRVLEIYDYNVANFSRICRDAKTFADESGVTTFLAGPIDEWGEGSIGYPNREHGFGIFEAIRNTFGEKPAEGWPLNYAPEDVGLECPQLN